MRILCCMDQGAANMLPSRGAAWCCPLCCCAAEQVPWMPGQASTPNWQAGCARDASETLSAHAGGLGRVHDSPPLLPPQPPPLGMCTRACPPHTPPLPSPARYCPHPGCAAPTLARRAKTAPVLWAWLPPPPLMWTARGSRRRAGCTLWRPAGRRWGAAAVPRTWPRSWLRKVGGVRAPLLLTS